MEFLSLERHNNRKIHKVWEKDKKDNGVLVPDEDIPLNLEGVKLED